MEKLYTVYKKRPRADCGSDPELLIAKFRLKLKTVGSQEIPGVTGKFSLEIQNEAGQRLIVLPRECTGHSKHPLLTTQEKTLHVDITRWSISKSD